MSDYIGQLQQAGYLPQPVSDIVDRLLALAAAHSLEGLPLSSETVAEAADEIVRLRNQLDAVRTGKALLALEAERDLCDQLIPFARHIARAEPYETIPMELDDVLWDQVHPTVQEAADARAAVAAYDAARKEEP